MIELICFSCLIRFAFSEALKKMYGIEQNLTSLPPMPVDGGIWSGMHSWVLPTRSFLEFVMFSRFGHFFCLLQGIIYPLITRLLLSRYVCLPVIFWGLSLSNFAECLLMHLTHNSMMSTMRVDIAI